VHFSSPTKVQLVAVTSLATNRLMKNGLINHTHSICVAMLFYFNIRRLSKSQFYTIRFVLASRLVSELTYNALMGTLNPTHSLTHSLA